MSIMNSGYYFLANDWVYKQTCAFLESFRTHNPDANLCWIPYNDSCDRVRQLQTTYNFVEYSDVDYLAWCDSIAMGYHNPHLGTFRKLAIWNGPFSRFTYIDIDTVILENMDFIFDLADRHDVVCGIGAHRGQLIDQVWEPSIYDSNLLTTEQIHFSVNTGLISSYRGHITKSYVESMETYNQTLKPHMVLRCQEQPLLNSLIVNASTNNKTISEYADDDNDMPIEWWAGEEKPDVIIDGGTLSYPRHCYITNRPYMLHWSSFDSPDRMWPWKELWNFYYHEALDRIS